MATLNTIKIRNVYASDDTDQIPEVKFKQFQFHGGEVGIDISGNGFNPGSSQYLWIDARVGDGNGIIQILTLTDALRRHINPKRLGLFLPYFPGARQDRVENGYPFHAKMYADLINSLKFDCVVIADPHSDVTPALINNVRIIHPHEIIARSKTFAAKNKSPGTVAPDSYGGLICPDAGATKRTERISQELKIPEIMYCRKKRDPKTGKLSGFDVPVGSVHGKYLLADDICDGGGTFVGVAESAKHNGFRYNEDKNDLYITHGIFSKGFDELLRHFGRIITTDSFPNDLDIPENVEVVELSSMASRIMKASISS